MPAPIRRVDKDGFPIATGSFEELAPQTVDPGFPKPPRYAKTPSWIWRWRWWLLALLLVAIFGIPVVNGGRHMVALWLLRQAEEHEVHGNLPAAAANADRALQWEPDRFERWEGYWFRAMVRQRMKDFDGALADLNQLVELLASAPEPSDFSKFLCDAYNSRSLIEESREMHREAIDDAELAVAFAVPEQKILALNNRAYVWARSGQKLEQALRDIEQVLKESSHDEGYAGYVDTRAYVFFRLGRYEEALADLNSAITQTGQEKEASTRMLNLGWGGQPFGDRFNQDGTLLSDKLARLNENLAVMHHHRGEVYDKLQQHDKAETEFHLANRLGYNPAKGIY